MNKSVLTSFLWIPLQMGLLVPGFQAMAQLVPSSMETASTDVCSQFVPTEVIVDGQRTMRYQVTNGEQLRCLPDQPYAPWTVSKDSWSIQDEASWQNFVYTIGKAIERGQCSTVDSCLVSSINPYRDQMDIQAIHFADCADFPMYLRAYFAFKNQLPFSMGSTIQANPPTSDQMLEINQKVAQAQKRYDSFFAMGSPGGEEERLKRLDDLQKLVQQQQDMSNPKDLRYTKNGNFFNSRINVPSTNGVRRDFFQIVRMINDQISSGSYRMLLTAPGQVLPDFYSPVINRQGIQRGTVVYKPTGHLSIVYDITDNGEIHLIDAHPDNSVTKLTYSKEYMRSLPSHGAGFKNWRPFRLNDIRRDYQGNILMARPVFDQDNDIPTFSLEQYFGNADVTNSNANNAKWIAAGRSMDWYDYVQVRLAKEGYRQDILAQFKSDLDALCGDLKGRATAVQTAVAAGIQRQSHPSSLPENIYGAAGEWEAYSTPGRDIRIRKRVLDLIDSAKVYLGKVAANNPQIDYRGTNLKKDLIKAYNQANSSCLISYSNSTGKTVSLGLTTALRRLTLVSFDPYFCPERRWGAKFQAELRTCADDAEKSEWYTYQQFLRNRTERDPNEVMAWSLDELRVMNRRGSVDNSVKTSDYDILKKLSEL